MSNSMLSVIKGNIGMSTIILFCDLGQHVYEHFYTFLRFRGTCV